MKKRMTLGLAITTIVLILFIIITSGYGIYVAFSASALIGLISLLVQPSPFIIGLVMFLSDKNIPEIILNLFK